MNVAILAKSGMPDSISTETSIMDSNSE